MLRFFAFFCASNGSICVESVKENGRFHNVFHLDIINENLTHIATSSGVAFHTNSDICSVKRTVGNKNIFHSAVRITSDDKTAVTLTNSTFCDDDILQIGFTIFRCSAGFHTDSVVAGVHFCVVDNHIFRSTDVNSVSVLSPFRIVNGCVSDDKVCNLFWIDDKFRRISERWSINQKIRHFGKREHHWSQEMVQLLVHIDCRIRRFRNYFCQLLTIFCRLAWPPDFPVVAQRASFFRQQFFPLCIRRFEFLHRTPSFSSTIKNPFSGEGNVFQIISPNRSCHFEFPRRSFSHRKLFDITAELHDGAFLHVEIDFTFQLNWTR